MKQRFLAFIPLFLLLLLSLGACASQSSAFNRYYQGRTLAISIVAMERVPELRYATPVNPQLNPQQETHHYLVTPSEEGMELVLMRLKVENHTATSAIVNIDKNAAELRDFFRGAYSPININERFEEVPPPENPGQERRIVFLWNRTLQDGTTEAFQLQMGYGIDGWMVFEAPIGTEFRELRWRAGDSLTIEF